MSLKDRIKKKKSEIAESQIYTNTSESQSYIERYEKLKAELCDYLNENEEVNIFSEQYSEAEQKNILKDFIQKRIETHYQNMFISNVEKQKLILDVISECNCFGAISQLYDDPVVDAIYVNGINEVFIEKDSTRYRTSVVFRNEAHLEKTITKIFYSNKADTEKSSCSLVKKLQNGTTITAILPPVATGGGYLVIKKFNKKLCNFDALIKRNFITEEIAKFLQYAYSKGLNIIITGTAGSGKTTLLSSLIKADQGDERTVFCRKSYEIDGFPSNYLILNETEDNNCDLFENALMLNPEKIVYPDIDKEDVFYLLSNTNAKITCCANAKNEKELLFFIIQSMSNNACFDKKAVHDILSSSIDLIVTTGKDSDGILRLMSISQIASGNTEQQIQPLITFVEENLPDGKIKKGYKSSGFYPVFAIAEELEEFDIRFNFFEKDYVHEYNTSSTNIDKTLLADDAVKSKTEFTHNQRSSIRERFDA